jgi:DNA-binding GntR family transcriptional regulator
MKPIANDGSMADRATVALRSAILSGDLEPNKLHAVHTVADLLGVSRTPVREALIRLAAEGMVQVHRNRGFVVLRTSAEELRQIFSLRLLLEVPATRAVAILATDDDIAALGADIARMREMSEENDEDGFLRADRQFHRTLLTISGNERLAEFVDSLRNVVLSTGVSTANRTESIEEILEPHVDLLRLVCTHDADGAARSMQEHILNTGRKLIEQEFGADEAQTFDEVLARFHAVDAADPTA